MSSVCIPRLRFRSPAKINLFLAVHGRRSDGFHELTSLVAPVLFGDELEVELATGDEDQLICAQSDVPLGHENLILQAAERFRAVSGCECFFRFVLDKRIPMGAGLGGGSGNAATALRAMNQLCDRPLGDSALSAIAAELGSDCPLFLAGEPLLMRGRGELLEALPAATLETLVGRRVILFKPDFPVATANAYQRLISAAPESYMEEAAAEARLRVFHQTLDTEHLLYNSFEAPIGGKFIAIPALLAELRERGVACLMSGSGSCCFALLEEDGPNVAELKRLIVDAWGETVFFVETSIAGAKTLAAACES